jgi:DNA-directed RNA polymerase specialized sigma24 family protein
MTRQNASEKFLVGNPLWNPLSNSLRNLVWRDGGMTIPRRNQQSTGCPQSRGGRRASSLPLLRRLERDGLDPAELARLPPSRRGRVAVLTQRARCDERAAFSLLVLFEPELESIWRHLVRRGAEREEAESQTVTIAWEVVSGRRDRRLPSSSSALSPTALANTIWTEVRRDAGHRRRTELDTVPFPEHLDVAAHDADPLERWPGLLGAAAAAGAVTPEQAVIVAETRIKGRPLAEVAEILERRYDAVRMERRRVEAALRAFALSYVEEES